MSFDPATVTLDDVDSLTVPQMREVLALHKAPELPKTVKRDAAARWTRLTLAATVPRAAIAGPPAPNGDSPDGDSPDGDSPEVALDAAPTSVIPALQRFEALMRMAEVLSRSNTTPDALRGKPNEVAAILLRANDLGIPATSAVDQLYVIHGKVGMEGKLMRALIRNRGHSIKDITDRRDADHDDWWDRWAVYGRRADNGDEQTVFWTLDDAVAEGLITSYRRDSETGRAIVVPARGKDQWAKMPRVMLKWRATSEIGRDLFDDCLAGVGYTPEELDIGDYVDEAGTGTTAAGAGDAPLTPAQQREQISVRISALDPTLVDEFRDEWKRRNFPPLKNLSGAAVGQVLKMLDKAEAKMAEREAAAEDEIDDVEEVRCAVCSATGVEFGESPEGEPVVCADRQACMGRVEEAAKAPETAAEPSPAPEDPPTGETQETALEGVSEAVETCREPGCSEPGTVDGYCSPHAPF